MLLCSFLFDSISYNMGLRFMHAYIHLQPCMQSERMNTTFFVFQIFTKTELSRNGAGEEPKEKCYCTKSRGDGKGCVEKELSKVHTYRTIRTKPNLFSENRFFQEFTRPGVSDLYFRDERCFSMLSGISNAASLCRESSFPMLAHACHGWVWRPGLETPFK